MDCPASCKDCCICVPKEDKFAQTEWAFPDEMECHYDDLCYPDAGHICEHFIPRSGGITSCAII